MRLRHLLLLALVLPLLAGGSCGTKRDPEPEVRTRPPVVIVEVRYVAVPAELTQQAAPAKGPVSEAIEVARERGLQLQQCNADKAAIRAIQGTKVPC
jgi:hypothetical protein